MINLWNCQQVTPAYNKTQPKAIFQNATEEDQEDGPDSKKPKIIPWARVGPNHVTFKNKYVSITAKWQVYDFGTDDENEMLPDIATLSLSFIEISFSIMRHLLEHSI